MSNTIKGGSTQSKSQEEKCQLKAMLTEVTGADGRRSIVLTLRADDGKSTVKDRLKGFSKKREQIMNYFQYNYYLDQIKSCTVLKFRTLTV